MTMPDIHEDRADAPIEMRSNPIPRYFAIIALGLVVWAVGFIAYFLLSGWSSEEEFAGKMSSHRKQVESRQGDGGSPVAAAAADPEALRAEGKTLYAQNCAVCHGPEGEGGIGPALNHSDYIYGRDAETVKTSISGGRPGGMPAFGSQFSTAQIEALTTFVTGL